MFLFHTTTYNGWIWILCYFVSDVQRYAMCFYVQNRLQHSCCVQYACFNPFFYQLCCTQAVSADCPLLFGAHQEFCGMASYMGRMWPTTAHQDFCRKWLLTWAKIGPPRLLWNGILHGPNEAHYGRLRLMRNDIFHGPSSADYPRISNIYFGTWGPIRCMVGPSPQDPLQA
jgi:hypothetical protein